MPCSRCSAGRAPTTTTRSERRSPRSRSASGLHEAGGRRRAAGCPDRHRDRRGRRRRILDHHRRRPAPDRRGDHDRSPDPVDGAARRDPARRRHPASRARPAGDRCRGAPSCCAASRPPSSSTRCGARRASGRGSRSGPPTPGPLVGRTAELEAIRAVLERVQRTGRGAALLIEGDAGVGKTRLLASGRRAGP